jgi:hypothetical protein
MVTLKLCMAELEFGALTASVSGTVLRPAGQPATRESSPQITGQKSAASLLVTRSLQ